MTQRLQTIVGGSIVVVVVAIVVVRWWAQPPAVEFDNLKYIQLLTTAVSARNDDWLTKVDNAVAERHEHGEMSDGELTAFREIIGTARDGNWEQADRDCYALAEAQLSRRRSKPPSNDHGHEH